jgi:hypothetical protein
MVRNLMKSPAAAEAAVHLLGFHPLDPHELLLHLPELEVDAVDELAVLVPASGGQGLEDRGVRYQSYLLVQLGVLVNLFAQTQVTVQEVLIALVISVFLDPFQQVLLRSSRCRLGGPFARSQVHEPSRVLLDLGCVGDLSELGQLLLEVGGRDVGCTVDPGLQEGLNVDFDVLSLAQQIEVRFDGCGEGGNENDFYFFVGELVLETVVLFVSFVGEF